MNRKDTEKDSDRPHYYSQFWLDVAAGRRVIGQPKPSDEAGDTEPGEAEVGSPAPVENIRRLQREHILAPASDGRANTLVHPVAEPVEAPEEFVEPDVEVEPEEPDYALDEADDLDLQEVDEADIPDMDLTPIDEEEEEEIGEFLEDEDEDLDWGGRGRKKNKPVRGVKQPKKPRREPRRGF